MLKHQPSGSGNPYSCEPFQRMPVSPKTDSFAFLGVVSSKDIIHVECEFIDKVNEIDIQQSFLTMSHYQEKQTLSTGEGHLELAQLRNRSEGKRWRVNTPLLESGHVYSYRFVGKSDKGRIEHTRWFSIYPAIWEAADDTLIKVHGNSHIRPHSVKRFHDGKRTLRVSFELDIAAYEHLTGFGERYDKIDQLGNSFESVVFEQYKSQGLYGRTYMPMPFGHVVGGEGWGFYIKTNCSVYFDFTNRESSSTCIVDMFIDGNTSDIPEIFFYDGSPTQVLSNFLHYVGKPHALPDWVFKLWASGNEWNSQKEVMRQVQLHQKYDIPFGVLVLEAWSDEQTFYIFRDAQYQIRKDSSPFVLSDFKFPKDGAWPNPKQMTDDLHAHNIKLVLWQIPLIKMRPHPQNQAKIDAETAKKFGYVVQERTFDGKLRPYRNRGWWFPLALMPDLGNDRAAKWWLDKRRYLVEELGIDGFKPDGGEHAWGTDLFSSDSTTPVYTNTFPVDYVTAYDNLLTECGKSPVTFSRAGYVGSQSRGAYWAGDENSTWEAFRWSINAGLNAAASGILYWGWDMAGFSGEVPSAELYLRAAAASLFLPIMQYHSEYNCHRKPCRDRTPWNIAERCKDDTVIPIFRKFAHMREALIPYLIEQTNTSIETGRPLMCPLYFDYPHDERIWGEHQEWMLGNDLLICPVTEPDAKLWKVYLPEGEWTSLWDGISYVGNQTVTVSTPIDIIPAFVKSGYVSKTLQKFILKVRS